MRRRPPLYLVRAEDDRPLELPRGEVLPKAALRRRDSPFVGAAIAVSLLAGAVLVAVAMGWLTF